MIAKCGDCGYKFSYQNSKMKDKLTTNAQSEN